MISEFMLQQTRIETVLPYYDRFLRIFPSLPRLARAPLQRVLRLWAGMGYYARARNLHAAARIIMKDWGGKIPSTKDDLRSLPGFGSYTAGAVASIAFNQRAAALDGNVKRVLSRLSGISDSLSPISKKRLLENFAEDLIPEEYASEFNQALMDLGATVCLPARPKCPSCPIQKFCSFPAMEKRTAKRAERKSREEVWLVALVEDKGRLLIHRKDGGGLLAGLWQFPMVVIPGKAALSSQETGKPAKNTLRKYLRNLFGIKIKFRKVLPPLQHGFTHIRATLSPYLFSLAPVQGTPKTTPQPVARWVRISGLSRYPVSRAMMKVAGLFNPDHGDWGSGGSQAGPSLEGRVISLQAGTPGDAGKRKKKRRSQGFLQT